MVTKLLVTETSAEPVKLNFLFLLPNQIQYRTEISLGFYLFKYSRLRVIRTRKDLNSAK